MPSSESIVRRLTPAQTIAERLELSQPALALLTPTLLPSVYTEQLLTRELYPDAIRFLAAALSRPGAVWWGALCAWLIHRPQPQPTAETALRAAVRWLRQPTEAHRLTCREAGLAAKGTPGGSLALAAAFSNGNMSGPNQPAIEVPSALPARLIAAAILQCGHGLTGAKTKNVYRAFLVIGLEVAQGKIDLSESENEGVMDLQTAFQGICAELPAYRAVIVRTIETTSNPAVADRLRDLLAEMDRLTPEFQAAFQPAMAALAGTESRLKASAESLKAELEQLKQMPPPQLPARPTPPTPPPIDPQLGRSLRAELLARYGHDVPPSPEAQANEELWEKR